jgi:hypothetical protein
MLSSSRNSPQFKKPKGPLTCSQKPGIEPSPAPHESNQHSPILRRMSGPKEEKVTRKEKKAHKQGLHYLCLSENIRVTKKIRQADTVRFPNYRKVALASRKSRKYSWLFLLPPVRNQPRFGIIVLQATVGRAKAQVDTRRPVTTEARVRARISPCGICGGQSGTGTGFPPSSSVFPCQYHSTVALQTHIIWVMRNMLT